LTAPQLYRVVRWLPVAAGLIYAVVLLRRVGAIVDQLTWNADYVSQMVLAQSIGTSGKSGRAIVIQIGYFWFDLLTFRAPFHRFVWEYAPFVMAMLALALITWTAWRLSGSFAGLLAASFGVAASPLVIGTQLAQAYHGTTWLGTALLASYLCWLLTSQAGSRTRVVVSAITAVVIGLATATDPLLVPAGDGPFAAAVLVAWRARAKAIERRTVITSGSMMVGAAAVAGAMLLYDRVAGYASSFPRGLTHVVPPEHFVGNLTQLVSGAFEVGGMPHGGSALGLVSGVVLLAGVLVPLVWLVGSLRGSMPAPLLSVIAFWSCSAVFVAAAFLFSDVPADFRENSARYLVSMFYVAVATVPLWAAASERRLALVAAPGAIFIALNAASVEQAAATSAFEPAFSAGLAEPIAFLEAHRLSSGYAAYDEAAPITWKTDFALQIYPVTEVALTPDDECGPPSPQTVCPFAYNSLSDWYQGRQGPTFILYDPGMYRLRQPPPGSLDVAVSVYDLQGYVIYVYADDVATHMGTPPKFKRRLI
jgi:hypothetical protein